MDLREIRQLIKLLAGTDIAEIEIREEAQTIRVTRQLVGRGEGVLVSQPVVSYAPHPPAALPVAVGGGEMAPEAPARGEGPVSARTITITSPMVGTYYQANSPDAPPLVARGDVVKKGQVVCIIEAMKLMNEIEAEHAGRIVSILKENASPVEYGEPLFVIEPA
ncbi:MAG: acetyl-CoA carboxylase biotin carboxyl carrier protein [Magnetococcus sp. DMHC-8]